MCIIVFKPKGIDLPSKTTLKTCFENNPDGAGFMYRKGNRIHILKGYMDFNSFYRALENSVRIKGGIKNTDLVIHFRVATHGNIVPGQTHPFPITGKYTELTKTKITAKQGLAHNGILNAYNPPGEISDLMSDTMWFIIKNAVDIRAALNNELNSEKFVLMDETETTVFGNFIQDNGIYYSNSSYCKYINNYQTLFKSDYWYIDFKPKYKHEIHDKWQECYYCGFLYPIEEMVSCEDEPGNSFICSGCKQEIFEKY